MLKNRKTVKGKLGSTRPKTTDFKSIANKKKKTTTKTVKSNRPTDARTKTLLFLTVGFFFGETGVCFADPPKNA